PKIMRSIKGAENLVVITAGSELKNLRQLESTAFNALLNQLESQVDVVIVDAPAISQSLDAVCLLNKGVNLLFVVWLKQSDKKSVQLAASELARQNIKSGGIFFFGTGSEDILAATAGGGERINSVKPAAEASVW